MARLLGSAMAVGFVLLLSPGAGSGSPVDARIVVGYTEQGDGGEPDTALAFLRADPRVRYAELDGVVQALRVPNDEFLTTQWSVRKTEAEPAWDLSTGSPQVVVAIIDTGIDAGQPDLRGK